MRKPVFGGFLTVLVSNQLVQLQKSGRHIKFHIKKPETLEPRHEKNICENKDADQLRGSREADQRLCFHYMDSTIPLLPKSEISSLMTSSVAVQPRLCRTWSITPKTGFLTTRLIIHVLSRQQKKN